MTDKLTIRTDTRITPMMKKMIDIEAREREITFSDIIRLAVKEWLRRKGWTL